MTEEEYNEILDACKPTPQIATNCGATRSPQENANAAWERLGKKLGFYHMTVVPSDKGPRYFNAVEVNEEPDIDVHNKSLLTKGEIHATGKTIDRINALEDPRTLDALLDEFQNHGMPMISKKWASHCLHRLKELKIYEDAMINVSVKIDDLASEIDIARQDSNEQLFARRNLNDE